MLAVCEYYFASRMQVLGFFNDHINEGCYQAVRLGESAA
ncbi:hypothetical protein TPHV1_10268 [Treponema phagedenis]|uniref:Uncharacterized protein n=1 Tax=Treponema phagedenis TaxID=162 RepID=A0A0B7GUH0_TREPH|nr:hypothetical protein TPHV1_10268 [Treponema phagedenis]